MLRVRVLLFVGPDIASCEDLRDLAHLKRNGLNLCLKQLDVGGASEAPGFLLLTVLAKDCLHVFELFLLHVHLAELLAGFFQHFALLDVFLKIGRHFAEVVADFRKAVLDVTGELLG